MTQSAEQSTTSAMYINYEGRAVNDGADKKGTHILDKSVSQVVGNVRANKNIDENWSDEINSDYQSRK